MAATMRCERLRANLPDFAIGRQPRDGVLLTVLDDYTDRSGPLRVMAVEPSSLPS
jgi:hypothetical protein